MRQVGLVACCAEKRSGACEAQHLYTSPLFVMSARAAASLGEWAILSAKHGLLLPRQVILPYDLALDDMPRRLRELWGAATKKQIRDRWPEDTQFVVFAGALYQEAVRGLPWLDALQGLPIGKRLKALKEGSWTR